MRSTTHRRLSGVLGGFLLVVVGGGVALVGLAPLRTPTAATQAALLGLAGVLDVVAAFDNPVTARIDWYRLSGLANVSLGLALPIGLLDWSGTGGDFLLVVMAVGGLALAAIGVDVALYAGEHIYERPLGE